METDFAGRIPLPGNKTTEAKKLFERMLSEAVRHYYAANLQSSAMCLRRVVDLAHEAENEYAQCKASALLGIVLLESDDRAAALQWLQFAMENAPSSNLPPWSSALRSLIDDAIVYSTTKDAVELITHKRKQLKQDVSRLETEIGVKATQLWHHLMTPHPSTHQKNIKLGENWDRTKHQICLFVYLLGRFAVRLEDHTPVALCSNRKGQALFKLLSTEPKRRFHKETLLDKFWHDEDPSVATGKLHVAVSRLRRALSRTGFTEDALLFLDNCYILHDGLIIDSDLSQFEEHLKTGQQMEAMGEIELAIKEFEAAIKVYRGDYLEDVIGEEWPLLRRSQLEQDFLKIHSRLINYYFSSERYGRVEASCRAVLERDNLREDIHRKLMICLSRKGQRIQALRFYQEVKDILQKELGVSPTEKTVKLATRIKADKDI